MSVNNLQEIIMFLKLKITTLANNGIIIIMFTLPTTRLNRVNSQSGSLWYIRRTKL